MIDDRGFFSYEHWDAQHEKHKLLARIQKSMVFQPLQFFDDGSFLAKVYPSNWYREHDKTGIVVRVIVYKLVDPQRAGHEQVNFRSQTTKGVKQEVYALSLAHFVIRALMLEAATVASRFHLVVTASTHA